MAKETKIKEAKISELITDDKNMNKHNQYGMSLLEKSISELGLGRSILVDKNNRIIAGNGVVETSAQIGLEDVIIVPTDGKKLVVVKREDIDLDSKEGRELAMADNAVANVNLEWDAENLQAVTEEWGIEAKDWGVKADDVSLSDEFGEDFNLKAGDKEPFQQMTFTFADEQAEIIKNAMAEIKETEEYKYCETFGNENSNGNAIFLIVQQWAEQRK